MENLKLEVLISAMHQKDFSIAENTGIKGDLLIINQCDEDSYQEKQTESGLWRMISTAERGLSKSRNMALDNARGDILLFADDDEVLEDNYEDFILNAYKELPDASAIVFNINRINNNLKKTYYKIGKIRLAPSYRGYGSPMITVRLKDIDKHGIRFNEKFGAGTAWGGGEENLFQKDIQKNKLKIYEYPATIATIDYGNGSQWFEGYDQKYFYNLGAFCKYRYWFFIRYLRFFYTCYKLRRDKKLSAYNKFKWMRLGAKGIKKDITYKDFIKEKNE